MNGAFSAAVISLAHWFCVRQTLPLKPIDAVGFTPVNAAIANWVVSPLFTFAKTGPLLFIVGKPLPTKMM